MIPVNPGICVHIVMKQYVDPTQYACPELHVNGKFWISDASLVTCDFCQNKKMDGNPTGKNGNDKNEKIIGREILGRPSVGHMD
jgi:hypothetical protein